MKILLVGAGAVGQVYGRHLALGGAEVAFLVKPKYAEAARAGFDMYALPSREPVRFEGFRVLTAADEVAREPWDAVFLCVSSTAIREGTWLAELARAIGDATLVMLQPAPEDRAEVLRHVPAERLVQGMIGLVSYPAPLPGETVPRPGVAYWLPPLMASPLAGPGERVEPLVEALRKGGMRSSVDLDLERSLAFGNAVLTALVAALERAGWSLRELRRGGLLRVAVRAMREAFAVAERRHRGRAPLALRLLGPIPLSIGMRAARCVVPFDLETYLRVHFTKVGDQTRLALETLARHAAEAGIPAPALEELAARAA